MCNLLPVLSILVVVEEKVSFDVGDCDDGIDDGVVVRRDDKLLLEMAKFFTTYGSSVNNCTLLLRKIIVSTCPLLRIISDSSHVKVWIMHSLMLDANRKSLGKVSLHSLKKNAKISNRKRRIVAYETCHL